MISKPMPVISSPNIKARPSSLKPACRPNSRRPGVLHQQGLPGQHLEGHRQQAQQGGQRHRAGRQGRQGAAVYRGELAQAKTGERPHQQGQQDREKQQIH